METNVKFKIVVCDLPQGLPVERVQDAVKASDIYFANYQEAEKMIETLPTGIYRINKFYVNELS